MHFPGHLRDAFVEWIDQGQPTTAEVEVDYEPRRVSAEQLLGQMVHCTDVLPGTWCDELDLPRGSTYAAAAQRGLAALREAH